MIGVIAACSTYERFTAWTAIGSIWPHSGNNRERNLDLAVSADGTRLAIAERNNQLTDPTPATVQLWTIKPFGEKPLWSQKVAAVESMAFSPNGKWVAVSAPNPFEGVVVLDGASGNQHMVLDVPKSAMGDIPLDLMFSPDSETLTLSSVGGFNDGEPYIAA